MKKEGFNPFTPECLPKFEKLLQICFNEDPNSDLLGLFNDYASHLRNIRSNLGWMYHFALEKHYYMSKSFGQHDSVMVIFQRLVELDPQPFTATAYLFCRDTIAYIVSEQKKVSENRRATSVHKHLVRFKSFLKAGGENSFYIYRESTENRMNLRILKRAYYCEYAKYFLADKAATYYESEGAIQGIFRKVFRLSGKLIDLTPPLKEVIKKWEGYSSSEIFSAYSQYYQACEQIKVESLKESIKTYMELILMYSNVLEEQVAPIYGQHLYINRKLVKFKGKLKIKMTEISPYPVELPFDEAIRKECFKDILESSLFEKYSDLKEGLRYFDLKREDDYLTLISTWLRPIFLRRLPKLAKRNLQAEESINEAIKFLEENQKFARYLLLPLGPLNEQEMSRLTGMYGIIKFLMNDYLNIDEFLSKRLI